MRRDEERPLSKGEKFTTVRALDQVVGKLVAPAEPATLLVAGKWRQLEGGIDDDTVILHHTIQSQRCVRNAAVGRRRVPVTLIPRPQARQNFPSTQLLPANLCNTERRRQWSAGWNGTIMAPWASGVGNGAICQSWWLPTRPPSSIIGLLLQT